MIYHGDADLTDWPKQVEQAITTLGRNTRRFDSIVVQGMSGVLVGAPAALALSVPLVVVRKESDYNECHSGRRVIGILEVGKRFAFVDDFISLGDTFGRCLSEIKRQCKFFGAPCPRCTAVYQYRYDRLSYSAGGYSYAIDVL